ncbi:MAG: hypothetical protein ABIH20_06515 [Candidatus Diapherotrites archaeon]
MYVNLEKEVQFKLVDEAIKKAGSERKLEKLTEIPDISINYYKKFKRRLSYSRFKKLITFLSLKEADFQFKLVNPKEFRVKGGKTVQEKYLKENSFRALHDRMRKGSSKYMEKWHAYMKKEKPEEYFDLQHSRFRKINKKKWKTNRGEFVRNEFEMEIANILNGLSVEYLYEPCMKLSSTYFPDFKVGNLIIECTAWRGEDKARSLSIKIQTFEKEGYNVKVVVPDNLRSFYKSIENHIISPNDLNNYFGPE